MQYKKGDTVSFINENLSGIVMADTGSPDILVEVKGLPMQVSRNEVVVLKNHREEKSSDAVSSLHEKSDLRKINPSLAALNTVSLLAAAENMQVLTGNVSFYILNSSQWNVYVSLNVYSEKKVMQIGGLLVSSNSGMFIKKFSRNELFGWQVLNVQMVFSKVGTFRLKPPLNLDVPLTLPDLNSILKDEEGNEIFARITELVRPDGDEQLNFDELLKKFGKQEELSSISGRLPEEKWLSETKQYSNLVVDLHIEKLTSDYHNLTNADMLALQLSVFRKKLDEAILKKYYCITFIHGVGNGVLKKAIRDELCSIPGLKFHDAPYHLYGSGATEVELE